MLLFKKRFLPAIRDGRKTQTVRLWKHRRMRAGQQSYIPGAGYIDVEAVDEVRIEELTEDDALADGFDSAEALRAALREIYPAELASGYRAYRVRFRLVRPAALRRAAQPSSSSVPGAIRQSLPPLR
jgi:hypothetical protein